MALTPRDVRFALSELFRPDDRQPLRAVCGTPSIQLLKDWHFGLVDRDDQLAAHLVLDAALVAELPQQSAAGGAEVGLLRAGSVVDSRVDDTGVVARLVGGDFGLFLYDGNLSVWMLLGQPHGGGEPNDATTDDGNVATSGPHSFSMRQCRAGIQCAELYHKG